MALNALIKRHLAPPTNVVSDFELVVLSARLHTLILHFNLYHLEMEEWTKGKSMLKMSKVVDSTIFDRLVPGRVNMMLKKEVSIQPYGSSGPTKARAIQYTVNERTAYEFGPENWAFSKALIATTEEAFVSSDVEFLVRYTAGMNHDQIGEFASDSEVERQRWPEVWIDERDGKNWDANVQVCHRRAMVDLYKKLHKPMGNLAADMICVKGKLAQHIEGVQIHYEVHGTVKSGHWDTGSGNGALNIEISVQAIIGLPKRLRPRKVRAMVMGDDYVAWLYFDHPIDPVELCNALNEQERKLGICPERGLFKDVLQVSYISLGFVVRFDGSIGATPKVGRMFAKLFSTVTPLAGRDPRRMASSIAHAFMPVFAGWKPMRDFLRYHMQHPPLDSFDVVSEYKTQLGHRYNEIDWRQTLFRKYGVEALGLELRFAGEQQAGWARHPVIDHLITIDLADPCDRWGCASR